MDFWQNRSALNCIVVLLGFPVVPATPSKPSQSSISMHLNEATRELPQHHSMEVSECQRHQNNAVPLEQVETFSPLVIVRLIINSQHGIYSRQRIRVLPALKNIGACRLRRIRSSHSCSSMEYLSLPKVVLSHSCPRRTLYVPNLPKDYRPSF